MKKQGATWGIDKSISITDVLTLCSIVAFGAIFYANVTSYQQHTDERITGFAEERKTQANQMIELQKVQNQMLLQLTTINVQQNYLTDTVKDLSSVIKSRGIK